MFENDLWKTINSILTVHEVVINLSIQDTGNKIQCDIIFEELGKYHLKWEWWFVTWGLNTFMKMYQWILSSAIPDDKLPENLKWITIIIKRKWLNALVEISMGAQKQYSHIYNNSNTILFLSTLDVLCHISLSTTLNVDMDNNIFPILKTRN